MRITTIEDNFEYHVKKIFDKMHGEFMEDNNKTFSDFIWENRERLGQLLFDDIDEYCGVDEFIEENY